jgi:hypothetical protein
VQEDPYDLAQLVGAGGAIQPVLSPAGLRGDCGWSYYRRSSATLQRSNPSARSIDCLPMGAGATAQRVVLGKGARQQRAFFSLTHHSCLGFESVLPYSADRGRKSMSRQALDALKQQIPLFDYLQAQD